jgi:hypothetical protein
MLSDLPRVRSGMNANAPQQLWLDFSQPRTFFRIPGARWIRMRRAMQRRLALGIWDEDQGDEEVVTIRSEILN